MSNQVQYAPFQPSRLASSPHPQPVALQHPSSSDLPSSPTTASFYNPTTSLPRSTSSRPRIHKSQSSTRNSSVRNRSFQQLSSSSPSAAPSNPFRLVHENARLQRAKEARPTRDLQKGETSLIPDEPGGWTRDGMWEEFDQYEREKLEIEMINERKEWKYRMRMQDEQASDNMLDPDDEFEEEGEEPPLDVLSEYEPPLPSPYDPSAHPPSLASSASSSPFLGPSSVAQSPASDMDDATMSTAQEDHFEESVKAFESTLSDSPCPRCGMRYVIGQHEPIGAGCTNCLKWEISSDVLVPLKNAFAGHGDAREGHLPLFTWTQFTETIVLCQACDEQFAA